MGKFFVSLCVVAHWLKNYSNKKLGEERKKERKEGRKKERKKERKKKKVNKISYH